MKFTFDFGRIKRSFTSRAAPTHSSSGLISALRPSKTSMSCTRLLTSHCRWAMCSLRKPFVGFRVFFRLLLSCCVVAAELLMCCCFLMFADVDFLHNLFLFDHSAISIVIWVRCRVRALPLCFAGLRFVVFHWFSCAG